MQLRAGTIWFWMMDLENGSGERLKDRCREWGTSILVTRGWESDRD